MATQQRLMDVAGGEPAGAVAGPIRVARLKEPDRKQLVIDLVDLERLIGDDHLARAIWELGQQLPTEGFLQANKSVEGHAGRPRICPKMLLSLWVYGYSQGLGEARAIAEEMRYEPALRWMAGNSVVSARTLSEFRIAHPEAMRATFENLLGMLEKVGLIDLSQMTLDGTNISSWAGSGSLRREKSLPEYIARVATVVELCARGHADQMVLSHDAACLNDWLDEDVVALVMPRWSFLHISNDVIPALREKGVTAEEIDQMLVQNPQKLFERQRSY